MMYLYVFQLHAESVVVQKQLFVAALALFQLRLQFGLVVSTHLLELLQLGLRLVSPGGDTTFGTQQKQLAKPEAFKQVTVLTYVTSVGVSPPAPSRSPAPLPGMQTCVLVAQPCLLPRVCVIQSQSSGIKYKTLSLMVYFLMLGAYFLTTVLLS